MLRSGGNEPAAILYTSGSTGRPKGILVSHSNLIAGARIVSRYLCITPADRLLGVLPFSFDYGLNQLLGATANGAALIMQRSHLPADICRTLEAERVSLMAAVPPLWIQMMGRFSPFTRMNLPALRAITNTGGVFPPELTRVLRTQKPELEIFLMYGLSEAFRSSYLQPHLVDEKPGSIGQAIPETELFVLDAEGRECEVGEVGELVHTGPTVAQGYWNSRQATEAVFRRHPFDDSRYAVWSGDLVRRDADGDLFFVGRNDQMIKTLGFRVSPEEVEEIIRESGLVAEVIVRGVPDSAIGASLVAHIVPENPDTFASDALLEFCRESMPSYMIPGHFQLHEALPLTSSGKIDRKRLAS
jgi:acyl-CoA synthetase (AMP-forming)/AMP-acid ligase II